MPRLSQNLLVLNRIKIGILYKNKGDTNLINSSDASQGKRKINPLLIVIAIIFVVVILGYGNYRSSRDVAPAQFESNDTKVISEQQINSGFKKSSNDVITIQTDSRIALKNFLKDPETAQIKNHSGNCGEVNSKNSFGGYSGYRRFIASPAMVVVEDENISTEEFQQAWNQLCKSA